MLVFKPARDDAQDAEAFCALSNSLYRRKVDERYYRWQFFAPPHPSALGMAWDGSTLCGCLGLHARPLHTSDQATAWILDVMVSAPQQRSGMFPQLLAFTETLLPKKQPVALCIMANERTRGAVSKQGWRDVSTLVTFRRATHGAHGSSGPLSLTRIAGFAECEDLLASNVASGTSKRELLANRRTSAFLDWRFLNNPRYSYEAYLARREGEAFAYVVLKVFRDPSSAKTFGDVVDVYWREDDPAALRQLLAFSLECFHERGVSEAAAWLQTNTMLDRVGLELGFVPSEDKRFFCAKVLQERPAFDSGSAWFLTMSDSEVY